MNPQCTGNIDLNYYDGNTVTAYWNYAQHYAMSDNYFGTTFGPSTPGAINIISGDTGNFNLVNNNPVTPRARHLAQHCAGGGRTGWLLGHQ